MNFSDLENSHDSTIFNNFQLNKYANLIANQRIHKSISKFEQIFAKFMRIINEILFKILEKLKKNKFFNKVFQS